MEKNIFYYCYLCGNVVTRDIDSDDQPICCREPMEKMRVQTEGADKDEHLPIISINANEVTVSVGATLHTMTKDHYIKKIYLVSKKGMKYKLLEYDDKPLAVFNLDEGDEAIGAYSYCNSHGLWYSEIN